MNLDPRKQILPQGRSIPKILEQISVTHADKVALVFEEVELKYADLNKRSNQLARYIQQRGLPKESLVAICMERSVEMVISILAVLKAGCAYVPLDPKSPAERLEFMLSDTQTPLILTQAKLSDNIPSTFQDKAFSVDTAQAELSSLETSNLDLDLAADQLAYTIYTSGSTGKPKGVQVEHRQVINLVQGQLDFVEHPVERFLYAYSFAFDGSVLLFFWTLLQGASLIMAPEDLEKDIPQLAQFIEKHQISHLLTFPSLYRLLLSETQGKQLQSLQSVSVAGEACPGSLVQQHHRLLSNTHLLNQYGPTEATVGATIYKTPKDFSAVKTPIGQCINGVFIYLLDEQLQRVETGATGEIYIGGKGLARTYLNRPDLTAERFIDNPFGTGRLYKTGDLACQLPDGNLDFIGRADFQVKLRGYRIEPGEIEAILLQHPQLQEAIVELRGTTPEDQKLVAYLLPSQASTPTINELRSFLAPQLPEYMIPGAFVFLQEMPQSINGKIDRTALPNPPADRPNLEQAYVAPQTALEIDLVHRWENLLGLKPIGIHDKFFELGGNSLQAARFIADLQKKLKENIFIVSLFNHPNIAGFAKMLEKEYSQAIAQSFATSTSKNTTPKTTRLSTTDFQHFNQYIPQQPLKKTTNTKRPPAIFILAPPRSGTTLLRVMLAGHPQLFAANELQLLHFNDLQERAEAYQGKFSLWREGLIRSLMELSGCTADEAKSLMQQRESESLTTHQMFGQLQDLLGDKILVDKSPSYVLDPTTLERAETIFDDAIYLHLVRHPYAMVRSFEKMHMDQVMYLTDHPYTAQQLGELIWTQSHQNTLQFLEKIPAHRQFRLVYEELVTQPETVMRSMCEQIGLAYHPDLIKPYQNIEQKMTDGLYADSKPMGDVRLLNHGTIKANLAEKWKGVEKDNFLSDTTWKITTKLGYPSLPKTSKKTKDNHSEHTQDIAIIGMSGRFPGAKNLEIFWENLVSEKDVSRTFTEADLRAAGISEELINDPAYVQRGMPLDDADAFDASFFGYLPKEAALMDPQHRVFLECAYAAFEDAGYDTEHFKGKIGVFGGVARNTYLINNVLTHPNYFSSLNDFQIGIALEKDFPATRVAYKLNLKGPAMNVQTACSSSGVAVHLACQSLLTKDSDMVLVGGGRIQPPLAAGHLHQEGHALSPDGYCKAFDAAANGMVRGHGMAFLILKKLDRAMADGDTIHAVIKATAINNDGADKMGFTAPSISGQSTAIQQAYQKAGFSPETVQYIEAHGTGTAIGDPIEVAGLTQAFGQFTERKGFCALGSVKTNIGHLDAGASIAGIIKTVLAMRHEKIPATLHFQAPNAQINFEKTPFFVNDQLRDWKRGEVPRRAGVSSFGLGGTNAHIVLEEAPAAAAKQTPSRSHQLLLLSAKTETALEGQVQQLGHFLEQHPNTDLRSAAYTLQLGRKQFGERAFAVAEKSGQAATVLQQQDGRSFRKAKVKNGQQVVFMFPGGGAQHSNMGYELYEQEPVFRAAVDECLQILQEEHDLSLKEVLYPPQGERLSEPIRDPLQAITLLFTIEYATAKLWQSWGVAPKVLIGHSLGEYTAACIAGIFTLQEALMMVATRGRLFLTLPEGGMLSVALSPTAIQAFLNEQLSIAAINKPDQCVLSGSKEALDALQVVLNAKEISNSRLHISVAAHSHMIEPILADFAAILKNIHFQKPTIPIISNLTGTFADAVEIQQPEYWLRHLRQTVRFSDGIQTLLQTDNRILLEVGPGQTLSTFTRQHPAKKTSQEVLASLRHPKETIHDLAFILKSLGQLWLSGIHIDWAVFHHHQKIQRISLPTYAFERKRHWIEPKNTLLQPPLNSTMNTSTSNPPNIQVTRHQLIIDEVKDIFQQLSGMDKEELQDQATFLEMGFDSLFLTQAVAKIKKKLPVKINFRQLFEEAPNLNTLAAYLDRQLPEDFYQKELTQLQAYTTCSAAPPTTAPAPQIQPITTIANHPIQPVSAGSVEQIIQQQLLLMQQQLTLLGHAPANIPAPQISTQGNSVHATNGVVETPQQNTTQTKVNPIQKVTTGEAFGPWKPLDEKRADGLTAQQGRYLQDLIQRYTERTKGSQKLTQTQRPHLADPRSITGFNRLWKDMVYQIAVERSKGAKLWDVDGNEYVDYRMAFGISLFGHSPDFVQEAVREQLEKGLELGVLTPLANKVADLLCELSGCERATLVNTGSEAISAAVRAARTVTMKDKIIVFEGDYHGIADEMLVRPVKRKDRTIAMPIAPGIPQSAMQNMIILNYDDPRVLDRIKAHVDEVAAIIIEPIQPNHPSRQPRELFHAIRQITAEHEIALIFDEMITGFRVAPRGAQEWYDVEPDLIAYGKIISGGLPMAAVAGKSAFMDAFDGGMWNFGDDSYPEVGLTFFGGTFVKHPLSLAAAFAALSEIKRQGPELYQALNDKTARFAERLRGLFVRTKAPLELQSTASIVAIKVKAENPLAQLLFFYLRLKGVHIQEKAALISTAHTEEDLDFTYRAFEESIKEMQTAGFFPLTVLESEDTHQIVEAPSKISIPAPTPLPLAPLEKKSVPLTEGQQEIWLEQQLGTGAAAAYNLSSQLRLSGSLAKDVLQAALQALSNRHEALRTVFHREDPIQTIYSHQEIEWVFHDFSTISKEQQTKEIDQIRKEEGTIPFDLFEDIPYRIRLIQLNQTEHLLFFTVHHIIADGWSMGILMNDLAKLYTALAKGQTAALPATRQLSDFVQEQVAALESEAAKAAENYWLDQFPSGAPILEFPTDRSRPTVKTYSAKMEKIRLDADLFQQLKTTATKEKNTLFNVIYTAFQVLVHRLSHQDDFVIGITAASQATADNPYLVAHGVNLLPVRLKLQTEQSFSETLKATRNTVLDAFEHQELAFGALVKKLQLPRDISRQPIISIIFNMDAPMGVLDFEGLQVELEPVPRHFETFDCFINIKPVADTIEVEWIYNTDLFSKKSIQNRLVEFKTLLESVVQNPQVPNAQLSILPKAERQLLLHDWNDTVTDFPDNICIHQLIEQQAQKTPQRIAVRDADNSFTYDALNQRANQVAHCLIAHGVNTGMFVGVYFERGVEMIISLLACMKVGAIYVPLDPLNPKDRLSVIIEDAQADYLITQEKLMDQLPNNFDQVICWERVMPRVRAASTGNLYKHLKPDHLVYVNYTSGSSGKPKGVLIPHYAVIDHHYALIKTLGLTQDEVIFSVASVAFDPSVQDFFMPLMIGASVYVANEATKTDAFQLKAVLQKVQPTLMQATPSTWRMLLLADWLGNEHLTILCGGEGLTKDLANKLIQRSQSLYNIYGPTETTIWSTLKKLDGDRLANQMDTAYEPIGRPLPNVQIYLLDEHLRLVPIGAAGELYIGGVGLAPNGYFKRPKLSAERFVSNPFPGTPGKQLYRTGDIARYLNNGDLEYLNRADSQVKIRGFRIELGEIESTMAQFQGIRENIMVIREDQEDMKQLVAYYIAEAGQNIDHEMLRDFLQTKLPDYMVPAAFVSMEAFPLTATMKVNRALLPIPTHERSEAEDHFVAPQTDSEIFLATLWAELLGIPKVSTQDDFFLLGGHSLIAVKMVARIDQEKGKRIPLSSLLEHSKLHKLAALLDDERKIEAVNSSSLVPIRTEGRKTPLYLVHGAGLHVLMFQTLAQNMDDDQPLYALQAKGIDGISEPLNRLENIAAHYIKEILVQNPAGPYALAGYSFGGLIAFEMAKQLRELGKTVEILAMFDTIIHQSITDIENQNSYYKRLSNLGKKVAWNLSLLARDPIPNLRYKSHVLKRRYQRWVGFQNKEGNSELRKAEAGFGGKVDQANKEAFESYSITPYAGKIHLFKAESQRFFLDDFKYLGWQPYAEGGVEIHNVPGDHLTLFDPPHGATFATILQQCLNRIHSSVES